MVTDIDPNRYGNGIRKRLPEEIDGYSHYQANYRQPK